MGYERVDNIYDTGRRGRGSSNKRPHVLPLLGKIYNIEFTSTNVVLK